MTTGRNGDDRSDMADVGHTEMGLRVTGINGLCVKTVGNKMGGTGQEHF